MRVVSALMLLVCANAVRAEPGDPPVIAMLEKLGEVSVSRGGEKDKDVLAIDFRINGDKDPKEIAAALKELATLPKLENLTLVGLSFTDEAVKELAGLKLKFMQIYTTKVTDEGFKTIGTITTLTRFSFTGSGLTDKGMKEVAKLKSLVWMELVDAQITDNGASEMFAMSKLRRLMLTNSAVTPEGMAILQRRLPGLRFGDDFMR